MLFLSAIIKAVDEYQDLLRVSVASAGNDHRLGANEAPPAIVSMFLGDELTDVLESIEKDSLYNKKSKVHMDIGVHVLPKFIKDTTDRNRTSPFAFTGNKFEFRMLGSAFSISDSNVILNTIVAEELSGFADVLESAADITLELSKLVKKTISEHKRIIFNGNNYSEEWVKEAEARGLLNLKCTPEALPSLVKQKNVDLFTKHKVFTKNELHSRYEIFLDNYSKLLNIEASTMLEMAKKNILPAVLKYTGKVCETANAKKVFAIELDCSVEEELTTKLSSLAKCLFSRIQALDNLMLETKTCNGCLELANFYCNSVFVAMQELRAVADELETITDKEYWPMPSYGDILFSVC